MDMKKYEKLTALIEMLDAMKELQREANLMKSVDEWKRGVEKQVYMQKAAVEKQLEDTKAKLAAEHAKFESKWAKLEMDRKSFEETAAEKMKEFANTKAELEKKMKEFANLESMKQVFARDKEVLLKDKEMFNQKVVDFSDKEKALASVLKGF